MPSFITRNNLSICSLHSAVGLSTNLKDLKSMGYKPFVVGFIAMVTVGLVSIISMQLFTNLFLF